jgi:adenosylcobyric acid synthase
MAKNIMFQGTGSTVGKSIMTAAVCRVLKDEGYSVAPF